MRKSLPALTEPQLEVMRIVWEHGEVTVAQVWDELASKRKLARNTVQTTMARLEEKGWLRSRSDGHAFRYRAAAAKKSALGTLIERLVDTTFEGSAEGLVQALLDHRGLSKQEAKRIRAMIDHAEENPR